MQVCLFALGKKFCFIIIIGADCFSRLRPFTSLFVYFYFVFGESHPHRKETASFGDFCKNWNVLFKLKHPKSFDLWRCR